MKGQMFWSEAGEGPVVRNNRSLKTEDGMYSGEQTVMAPLCILLWGDCVRKVVWDMIMEGI